MEPTLSEAQIKRVWEGMLGAEARAGYFAELSSRYFSLDRLINWATLTLSAGFVVSAQSPSCLLVWSGPRRYCQCSLER